MSNFVLHPGGRGYSGDRDFYASESKQGEGICCGWVQDDRRYWSVLPFGQAQSFMGKALVTAVVDDFGDLRRVQ